MGIPIILRFNKIVHKVLIPKIMATNSAPNTDISIVDSFLEYQLIRDMFM